MSRPVPWKYLLKVQLPILLAIMIAIGVFGKQKASAIAFTAFTSTDPAPAAPQSTVILLLPWPDVMDPPLTIQVKTAPVIVSVE